MHGLFQVPNVVFQPRMGLIKHAFGNIGAGEIHIGDTAPGVCGKGVLGADRVVGQDADLQAVLLHERRLPGFRDVGPAAAMGDTLFVAPADGGGHAGFAVVVEMIAGQRQQIHPAGQRLEGTCQLVFAGILRQHIQVGLFKLCHPEIGAVEEAVDVRHIFLRLGAQNQVSRKKQRLPCFRHIDFSLTISLLFLREPSYRAKSGVSPVTFIPVSYSLPSMMIFTSYVPGSPSLLTEVEVLRSSGWIYGAPLKRVKRPPVVSTS